MKFFKIASFFLLLAAIFGIVLAAPADKNAVEKASDKAVAEPQSQEAAVAPLDEDNGNILNAVEDLDKGLLDEKNPVELLVKLLKELPDTIESIVPELTSIVSDVVSLLGDLLETVAELVEVVQDLLKDLLGSNGGLDLDSLVEKILGDSQVQDILRELVRLIAKLVLHQS